MALVVNRNTLARQRIKNRIAIVGETQLGYIVHVYEGSVWTPPVALHETRYLPDAISVAHGCALPGNVFVHCRTAP